MGNVNRMLDLGSAGDGDDADGDDGDEDACCQASHVIAMHTSWSCHKCLIVEL